MEPAKTADFAVKMGFPHGLVLPVAGNIPGGEPMATTTLQSSATDDVRRNDQFHALKKLRSEDSAGVPDASGARSLDGFAEVFAAIAASSTAPVESSGGRIAPVEPVASAPDADHSPRDSATERSAPPSAERPDTPTPDRSPVSDDRPHRDSSGVDASTIDSASEATADPDSQPTTPVGRRDDADPTTRAPSEEPAAIGTSDALNPQNAANETTTTTDQPIAATTRRDRADERADQGLANPPANAVAAADADESTPAGELVSQKDPVSVSNKLQAENDAVGQAGDQPQRHASDDAPPRDDRRSPDVAPEKAKAAGPAKPDSVTASKPNTNSASLPPELTHTTAAPQASPVASQVASAAAAVTATTSPSAGTAASSAAGAKGAGVRAASAAAPPVANANKGNHVSVDPKAAAKPATNGREDAISRVRLVQRVSRAFQGLGAEGGRVRLRLAPDELGSVQVDMKVVRNTVDAKVIAQSEAAGAALREHLPELRSRLESFGLNVESLEVEVDGESAGFDSRQSSGFENDEGFGQHPRFQRRNRSTADPGDDSRRSPSAAPAAPAIAATGGPNPAGQIDLRL